MEAYLGFYFFLPSLIQLLLQRSSEKGMDSICDLVREPKISCCSCPRVSPFKTALMYSAQGIPSGFLEGLKIP